MFKYIFTSIFILTSIQAFGQSKPLPEKLAQEQLDAYNKRDIDSFVAPYAENVKVYEFPDKLMYEGNEEMKNIYGRMFARTPDLHCKLLNRIVMGNTVIDHEEVTLDKNQDPIYAIAIYKIENDKIAEVYFIRP